jgi:hypothetical protein
LKINECVEKLSKASEALESAPRKGFVNLDEVKATINQAKLFLGSIQPQHELGEKLIQDYRESMLAKLKVLKLAGAGTLISQAEKTLNSDDLNFDQWKKLQTEIEQSLRQVFGGQLKSQENVSNLKHNLPRKPDDYR